MDDDEINAMLERMNSGGVPEIQLQRVLELLGAVEHLSAELEATLTPSQSREVRKEVTAATAKVFRQTP